MPIAGKLALGHISPMLLTAARWGIAAAILAYLGRQRFAADWPAIRARLPLLIGLGFFGFTVFNVALYSRTEIHLGDQRQHRAGRHADADLHHEFPAVRAARHRRADRRLRAVGRRRGADGEPWRTAAPAAARGQFRRRADAAERHRLQRLHGGAAQQAGSPLAEPDDRADRHRLRHDPAVRGSRVRLRRRHRARRHGLGGHRLHRDLPVDPVAGLLHTRRRVDRRQPRRPVHQSRADLRHAAVDHHPRRGLPRLPRHRHGAGVRRHLACRDQRTRRHGKPRAANCQVTRPRRRTAAAWPNRSTCGLAPSPGSAPGTARRDRAARWHRRRGGYGRARNWRC